VIGDQCLRAAGLVAAGRRQWTANWRSDSFGSFPDLFSSSTGLPSGHMIKRLVIGTHRQYDAIDAQSI
jgi:hypothetical protein